MTTNKKIQQKNKKQFFHFSQQLTNNFKEGNLYIL